MGENNTIGLLTNINNSLNRIVEMMLPQNKDPQKSQEASVKSLSQGSLGSAANAKPAAGGTSDLGGINVAQIVSALDGLPEQIKAIAKLSGKTIKDFSKVMLAIVKVFSGEEFKSLNKDQAAAAKEMISAITELGKLPTALKDVSKIKEKDAKNFAKVVGKLLEMITTSLRKSKIEKKDIELAKNTADTILALTTAVKSLAKMTLIAPLAMIGLVAMIPVWIAFSGVLMLIGLLEKPIKAGLRALRGVDNFMNRMMKTALLMLAVAGGVLLLGLFVKKHFDLMLYGLAGMMTVFVAVGIIAVLGGLIGLLIKSMKVFDKQIIKFVLGLMLIAGLTIVLGMLLQVGWKQALIGLGGMIVLMLAMLGVAVLIKIVGEIGRQSIKDMAGVMFLMLGAMLLAMFCVALGSLLEENIDLALYGFTATAVIIGAALGIMRLAKTAGKGAKSAVKDLLMCEGVILAAMAIVWATIKTGELVWDYFGTDTGTALAKVAIIGAVTTGIIMEAWAVSKIANKAQKDIKKGALALLLAEGVILGAVLVTAAVITVSKLIEDVSAEQIAITFTVMAGIVSGAAIVAAVASKFQSTIMKGALVMAILELLILGMVGVMYAIVKVAQGVNALKNGWVDILLTVDSMAALVIGFTAFAALMGVMITNPYVLAALALGATALATVSILIFMVTGATMMVVKLAKQLDEVGKTPEELGAMLKSVATGIFSYENLNPGVTVIQALKLAAKYVALMPVFLGMSMMIRVVSNMARQFGGMVEGVGDEGKYGIRPFYGMNGTEPIYGEPVYIPEIASQIVESVNIFANRLQEGFEKIDLARLFAIGVTVGYIVDPVSKFAQMLTGLTNGNEPGTLRPVILSDGKIILGPEVKVVEVAALIAQSISTFAKNLYGDGDSLPSWMSFTRKEKHRNRVKNAMGTLAEIVEPIDTFVQLLTSYQSAGPNMIRKIKFDSNGNLDMKSPAVNVVEVSSAIASAISVFANRVFGDDADWMSNFKKVDDNGETKGLRGMKALGMVISPISSFVEALTALDPDGNKLYAVTTDEKGNIHRRPVDLVNTASAIASAVSIFVNTLFSDANRSAWHNMITGNMPFGGEESSGGAVGCLSVVIDPISNFANALYMFAGEAGDNGNLLIPIYDRDGKQIGTRALNLVFTANNIAKAVTTFLKTLFGPENYSTWMGLIYGYDSKGNLGNVKNENLKDSVGIFATVIAPVVQFMDIITKFGGTPDNFQIFDGDKPRTINLIEVSNAIASAVTAFINGMNPAFESMKDFDLQKKQDIEYFSQAIGSILENFAKIGETKKEQIDLSVVVIDTYFTTVATITEKVKDEIATEEDMDKVDKVMQKGIAMFSIFKDIKFEELNYKKGFEAVLDVFKCCKDVADYATAIPKDFSFEIITQFTEAGKTLNEFIAGYIQYYANSKDSIAEVAQVYGSSISLIAETMSKLPTSEVSPAAMMVRFTYGARILNDFLATCLETFTGEAEMPLSAITDFYINAISSITTTFINLPEIEDKGEIELIDRFTTTGSILNWFFVDYLKKFNSSFDVEGVTSAYLKSIKAVANGFLEIPLIPNNDENRAKFWFIDPYVAAAISINAMLFDNATLAENAAATIDIITQVGSSMLLLSEVPPSELDKLSNSYNNLLERVVKLSDKKNTKSVTNMNDALKDATTQMTKFDKRLIEKADDRKKKMDELIESVATLNEKLEATGEAMRNISNRLTEINSFDGEALRKKVDAANGGGSRGGTVTGGGEGTPRAGGENVPVATGTDAATITDAISKALKGLKLVADNVQLINSGSLGGGNEGIGGNFTGSLNVSGLEFYIDADEGYDHNNVAHGVK